MLVFPQNLYVRTAKRQYCEVGPLGKKLGKLFSLPIH